VSMLEYPLLGSLDLHLYGEGRHERIWEKLGAHRCTQGGVVGVGFAVFSGTYPDGEPYVSEMVIGNPIWFMPP